MSDGSSTPERTIRARQSDDAEPVRPRDECVQRRSADLRRADADSDDREGDTQPLPSIAARRRSPVEDRRASRKGREPRAEHHSDRCEVRRRQRAAVSGHLERSLHVGRACSSRAAAFASDAITVGDRLTINAGVRFDHSRAISQDLRAIDPTGRETDRIIGGLGTLYTWNLWSPRLGATDEAHRRRPNDAARELRAVQPGRADRRVQRLPPRGDADHDHDVRSADRRLHAHRLGR